MQIVLKRAEKMITEDFSKAYRINSGCLQVFLQPVRNGCLQRQMFLGEYRIGNEIPSLCKVWVQEEINEKYCFQFTALEETVLEIIESTDQIRDCFYSALAVSEEEREKAGEDQLLIRYQTGRKDKLLQVQRMKDLEEHFGERSADTVLWAFQKEKDRKIGRVERTDNEIYNAAAYLCKMQNISIASYERVCKAVGTNMTLDDIARISGFICRKVEVQKDWGKILNEPMLCRIGSEREWGICIPTGEKHVRILLPAAGKCKKMKTEDNVEIQDAVAWVFHRPFREEHVAFKDIVKLTVDVFSFRDLVFLLLCMTLTTGIGIQLASLSQMVYDVLIPQGDSGMILGIGGMFLLSMAAGLCFAVERNLISYRMDCSLRYTLQAAVYEHVFHLPENFFRNKDSAEQAYRIQLLTSSYMRVYKNATQILLQGFFSLAYVWKMHSYSAMLSHIATVFVVLNVLITIGVGCLDRIVQRNKTRMIGQMRSFLYQTMSGIEVIRAFGAEDDILQVHMERAEGAGLADKKSADNRRVSGMLGILSNALAVIVLYDVYMTRNTGISIGQFMGFVTAFMSFSGVMCIVAGNGMDMVAMLPMLKDSVAFLKISPERSSRGEIPEHLSGEIQLSHVNFSYGRNQKLVLQDISLHIHPGEYVGIVGETGCGKSTLLRLLLGFDRPLTGQIYYDGITIDRFCMTELRRRMGVVLQDGSLFSGSIYRNIKIACPQATAEQIEQAVEDSCLREVIDRMPMGLETFVSEQGRTLSGGEKQRILIARAIVGNPDIIFFDEATSSLDNISQNHISTSLEKYHVTRLVVAHRLSTIMHCDRIIVLDKGRIVESGTYSELIAKQGKFLELTQKQIIK